MISRNTFIIAAEWWISEIFLYRLMVGLAIILTSMKLAFSPEKAKIVSALQSLTIGWGADWYEAVYDGLTQAILTQGMPPYKKNAWRDGVKKVVLLMGDAPPHDPEPFTGYTMDSVVQTAESVDPAIIYAIVIGGDPTTYYYFSTLASRTGGKVFTALTANEVVNAMIGAIGDITEPVTNKPPDVSEAIASVNQLWPPDHRLESVSISNVKDPDGDPVTIVMTAITQDEPVTGQGSGNTSPDGSGIGTNTAWLRAERAGISDNGRVYKITFTANDGKGGQSTGNVLVCVPHDQGVNIGCVDDGQIYDATLP